MTVSLTLTIEEAMLLALLVHIFENISSIQGKRPLLVQGSFIKACYLKLN